MQPAPQIETDHALVQARHDFLRDHQQQLRAVADQWINRNVPHAPGSNDRVTNSFELELLFGVIQVEANLHPGPWRQLLQDSTRRFVAQMHEVFPNWFQQARPDERTLVYLVLREVRDHVRACVSVLNKLEFIVSC